VVPVGRFDGADRANAPGRDRPATYSMVPVPGELPVATWRLEHGGEINSSFEEHAHDFPGLAYFQGTIPDVGIQLLASNL
jgi:hypothetical protein